MGIWILISVTLAILCGAVIYALNIQIKKVDFYEEYIKNIKLEFNIAYDAIKALDMYGAFDADDEVGISFKQLRSIVDRLEDVI